MERVKRKKNKNGSYLRVFKRGSTAQSEEEFKNQMERREKNT
jgi:hypothetical protein